jgi:predicted negative regulator of RcsB-dependent stress response
MELVTTKIRKPTLKRLKLLAVLTDTTMLDTLDRLIEQELARIQAQQKDTPHADDPRLQNGA